MAGDLIRVAVGLSDKHHIMLEFSYDLYQRHLDDARAAGVRLEEYLARKIRAGVVLDSPMLVELALE
jgi:hypothetical protein